MLKFLARKELPAEKDCEFDHGDVDQSSGRVFVAHTSSGTVEVLDGLKNEWIKSIPGCAGGSGVVFDAVTKKVFAASRAEGHILKVDPGTLDVMLKFETGKKPNGLAVDGAREILMTADVGDNIARFHDQNSGEIIAEARLRGRPRWATYRKDGDEYLLNIMDPSGIQTISGKGFALTGFIDIDQKGAHGLLVVGNTAYIACDDATLVSLDISSKEVLSKVKLAGPPDVLWYNQRRGHLYCSIGDPGVLQVFDGKTAEILQQVETEYGSHTLTFDENLQKLYIFLPESTSVGIYSS